MSQFEAKPARILRLRLGLSALGLILVGLACQINVGGPSPPSEPIQVSTLEAQQLEENWLAAFEADPVDGRVRVVITERQLTAFLAARMADGENPLLKEPQVWLRAGEIQIFGVASAGPLEASALLSIQPQFDSEGVLAFNVTTAEVGPVPLPDTLKQGLSDLLTEAFTGKLGSVATGIRITSLAIADGEAVIVGELR
jgi:hypothetical protein